ncbi:MAG: hypothetical protein JW744_04750 [Candidatus Diapherotrites archaeon]|uniref:Uncharacterized protein n=1 Tax=Candidatus Iainarchaeum sp. TaxID=3101447 RepID=A0A938YXZ5_9ARCH|nr:hypothetical protein [Candidatus Diapherotrites archaeon]
MYPGNLKLNKKGQEFSGFRLLVEAVMVVLIMVIIFAILTHIESIRHDVSKRKLFDGFKKAFDAPDGSVIFEENLVLTANSAYTAGAFANTVTGISPECIEFRAIESPAFLVGESSIEIGQQVETDVYYSCQRQYEGGECPITCIISFGRDLRE